MLGFSRNRIPNLWTALKGIKIKLLKLLGIEWENPAFNYYFIPKKITNAVNASGYSKENDLIDFWFENRKEIIEQQFNNRLDSELIEFEETHKWLTPIGKACLSELINYLSSDLSKFSLVDTTNGKKRKIDFNDFSFEFEDKKYDLKSFNRYLGLSFSGVSTNLKGIKLHHTTFRDCILEKVDFSYSMLYDLTFERTILKSVNFYWSKVKCCQFSSTSLDRHCSTMMCNLYGCQFAHMDLTDEFIDPSIQIKKVSYSYLIMSVYDSIYGKFWNDITRDNTFRYLKHNSFLNCTINNLNRPESRWFKNYIFWYQNVMFQFGAGFGRKSLSEKLQFFSSVVFTKCWSSYIALASSGLLIVLIFSGLYCSLSSEYFNNFDGKFMTAFYYSIVTFTTLGYGDIYPTMDISRWLVISEVILGYITLGSFIFLIGHKASDRY
jgi:hypothetical protein